MKRIFVTLVLLGFLVACGSGSRTENDKKQTENYPTYDTTDKVDHINDSVSDGGMREGGDLRQNVDDNNKEQ